MDKDYFKEVLLKETSKYFSWKDCTREENDYLTFKTIIYLNAYDVSTDLYLFLNDNSLSLHFLFGYLSFNSDTLKLINDFNKNVNGFKVSVLYDNHNMLRVEYFVCYYNSSSPKDIVYKFLDILDDIKNKDTIMYLNPLICLTK